jgi:hypothetical protein
MFARRVSLELKSNNVADFTERMEKEVLPMLRKQKGFQDEITLVATGGTKAFGISLWDRKEDAETYASETYPQVEKILAKFVDGSPRVSTFEVTNSTFHKIGSSVPV